jgi:hypothetical protein
MEFLDIKFSKRLESFAPCYSQYLSTGGFERKAILFSGFKNPYKKSVKKENWSLFMNSILEQRNKGRKPHKNSNLGRLEFMPRKHEEKCCSRIPSPVFGSKDKKNNTELH